MQDAQRDLRLRFRRFLVPAAAMGQRFGPIILMVGLFSRSTAILQVGVLLLAGTSPTSQRSSPPAVVDE